MTNNNPMLADYIEQLIAGGAKTEASRLRTMVDRFERAIGRYAKLADLNAENRERFEAWLKSDQTITACTRRNYLAQFRFVWRAAHRAGAVAAGPQAKAAQRERKPAKPDFAGLPLTQCLARIEAEEQADRSHDHRYNQRRAGELFVEFAGFDPPVGSIGPTMLGLFEVWLRDSGREKTAERYRRMIECVARRCGAAIAARKPGGRPKDWRPAPRAEPKQGELWHLFVSSYQRKHRSHEATARQYQLQIDHLGRFLGHVPTLDDLTDEQLDAFVADRAAKVAAPTANKAYWCLVALWRHAHDLGLVRKRPTVQPLPEPEQIPFAWLKPEVEALLRACADVEGTIGEAPANLWWLGLHWVLWSSGERIGALLEIGPEAFDAKRGELFVPAEARKGRRKPKFYPLLPQAVEVLKLMQAFQRERLFPCPFDRTTLYNRYKRILKAAGLPTDRKCKFHKMRRSFASYIEAAGGNATVAMGHSSRRVAERSYLDPRICGDQNVAKLLPMLSVGDELRPATAIQTDDESKRKPAEPHAAARPVRKITRIAKTPGQGGPQLWRIVK